MSTDAEATFCVSSKPQKLTADDPVYEEDLSPKRESINRGD